MKIFAYFRIGKIYYGKGQYEIAINYYDKAISLELNSIII